jgi:hypothetical protein
VRRFSIASGLLAAVVFTAGAVLPARADAGGDIENALGNTLKQPSYHMHMIMSNGDIVDGDVVTPDRMQIVVKQGEMIVVGTTTYFKLNGTWQKFPGASPMQTRTDVLRKIQANKGKYTVEDLGMKVVGDVPLHAYRSTDSATKHTTILYVDRDHRIVRIESDDDTMQFTNFGEHVSITAPI